MNLLIAIILMIIATLIGALGSFFLKKGSSGMTLNIIKLVKNGKLIFGVFLYFLSSLLFIWLLKSYSLSFLYPLTAFSYIWVTLLSIKYLNERMNTLRWAGIFLIIAGIVFVTV